MYRLYKPSPPSTNQLCSPLLHPTSFPPLAPPDTPARDNVLLCQGGLVKLCDFGLVEPTGGGGDALLDLRALGALLYSMSTTRFERFLPWKLTLDDPISKCARVELVRQRPVAECIRRCFGADGRPQCSVVSLARALEAMRDDMHAAARGGEGGASRAVCVGDTLRLAHPGCARALCVEGEGALGLDDAEAWGWEPQRFLWRVDMPHGVAPERDLLRCVLCVCDGDVARLRHVQQGGYLRVCEGRPAVGPGAEGGKEDDWRVQIGEGGHGLIGWEDVSDCAPAEGLCWLGGTDVRVRHVGTDRALGARGRMEGPVVLDGRLRPSHGGRSYQVEGCRDVKSCKYGIRRTGHVLSGLSTNPHPSTLLP
jgi:hypothetical protein